MDFYNMRSYEFREFLKSHSSENNGNYLFCKTQYNEKNIIYVNDQDTYANHFRTCITYHKEKNEWSYLDCDTGVIYRSKHKAEHPLLFPHDLGPFDFNMFSVYIKLKQKLRWIEPKFFETYFHQLRQVIRTVYLCLIYQKFIDKIIPYEMINAILKFLNPLMFYSNTIFEYEFLTSGY